MKFGKDSGSRGLSEISLWLDSYNDIFSSFDSRPYSQRALSIDFLDEAERASRDKSEIPLTMRLHVGKEKRRPADEALIKARLRSHFGRHLRMLKEERNGVIRQGLEFVTFGVFLMVVATMIIFNYGEKDIYTTFLVVLLEPAGWFLFWEGLNTAIFESKKANPKLAFYRKMSKCRISFEQASA